MAIDHDLDTIISKIGKPSNFTYPGDEASRKGRLKDRSGLRAPKEEGRATYWPTVDLIEYQEEPDLMRFGYYRGSSSQWGAQATLAARLPVWKKLFVKAAREKPWFRKLLEDVMRELEKSATH